MMTSIDLVTTQWNGLSAYVQKSEMANLAVTTLSADSVDTKWLTSTQGLVVNNGNTWAGLGIDPAHGPYLALGNKSFTADDLGPQTMEYGSVQLNSELTSFTANRNTVYNVEASTYAEIHLPSLNGAPWTVMAYVSWTNYEYPGAVTFEYVPAGKPHVGENEASFSAGDEAKYMMTAKWTGSALVMTTIKQ